MKAIMTSFKIKEGHCPHSLGAQSIARYCTNRGYNVELISLPLDVEEATKILLEKNPEVCGFSSNFFTEKYLNEIIKNIKSANDPLIVIGGPSVTYSNSYSSIRRVNADLFVKGDGEEAFYQILCRFNKDRNTEKMKCIGGVFEKNSEDNGFSFIDLEKTDSPFPIKFETDHIYWETTRGCAFNCIYCAHPGHSNRFRHVPLERVKAEAEYISSKDFRAVYITDPVLGGEKSRSKEVLKILRKLKGKFITAEYRAEYLDEENLDLLKEASIGWLELGLQTTNLRLSYFRKNSSAAIENLQKLAERGIKYSLDLIVGIPGDTKESFEDSLKFAIETAKPSSLKVFPLRVYEGTKLHEMADRRKDWEYDINTRIIKRSHSFNQEEFLEWAKFGDFVSSFYNFLVENNWFWEERKLREFTFFKKSYEKVKYSKEKLTVEQMKELIKEREDNKDVR